MRISAPDSYLSGVHFGNAGINKPFDRILKSFADEVPELFLRLPGFVPAGVELDIQPLRSKTAPAMVLPDYVAVVRTGPDVPIIFNAEFQSTYHHDVPRDMARYGESLAWQHQVPVEPVLVMLRPKGVLTDFRFANSGLEARNLHPAPSAHPQPFACVRVHSRPNDFERRHNFCNER